MASSPSNFPVKAVFSIKEVTPTMVFIMDMCNELNTKSITNDAEAVVADVHHRYPGRRIIYRDSDSNWDELVHDNGVFVNFAPWRK